MTNNEALDAALAAALLVSVRFPEAALDVARTPQVSEIDRDGAATAWLHRWSVAANYLDDSPELRAWAGANGFLVEDSVRADATVDLVAYFVATPCGCCDHVWRAPVEGEAREEGAFCAECGIGASSADLHLEPIRA